MPSVMAWDSETVPDLHAYAAANGMQDATEAAIIEAIGDKLPRPVFNSIICIGALIAHREDGVWVPDSLSAPSIADRTEKQLIKGFCDKIDELSPQLVTFAGSGFDLPVLRYRAMLHRVHAPGFGKRSYFNRYSEDSLDLCDVLSSFGSSTKLKLDEVCKAMGLAGKASGIDGSQVAQLFREGRIQEIADYCRDDDVLNTYRLWLRYELFRGRLNNSDFELSEEALAQFLEGQRPPPKPVEEPQPLDDAIPEF